MLVSDGFINLIGTLDYNNGVYARILVHVSKQQKALCCEELSVYALKCSRGLTGTVD